MNEQELRDLYDQYVANNGKLSFSKWKQRYNKNDKRKNLRNEQKNYEQMLKDREEAINKKRASILEYNEYNSLKQDPLYKKINNILGEETEYYDAQSAINRARRDKIIDNNKDLENIKNFLRENEGLFYDENGERILYNDPNDLLDVDKELRNFTKQYDKENNVVLKKEGEKSTNKKKTKKSKQQVKNETREAMEQTTKNKIKEGVEEGAEETLEKSSIRKIIGKRSFGVILNSGFAISDYKDARNQGKGVIRSAARAGALFAAGEMLQGAMLPVMMAKNLPSMIVSGVDSLQRTTREMNNYSRFQTFGDAHFQDTQQLATMRQAGMEMAKMSQYNLQQSIMGNEAQYLHRI